MIITLLGNYGVTPMPHKHLSSAFVSVKNSSVLLDCGEGTQTAIRDVGVKLGNLSLICLTHYHPDHILGLPGLISSLDTSIRDSEHKEMQDILIVGPPDPTHTVNKLISCVYHENVNVRFISLNTKSEHKLCFENFNLKVFPVKHSVGCLGYAIEEKKNPRTDKEQADRFGVDIRYWNFLQSGYYVVTDENDLLSIDEISSNERKANKVVYATDTLPVSSIIRNCKDADLAILEGMYYKGFTNKNGSHKEMCGAHMTFEEAASIAREARVGELWLTHFSPVLTLPEEGLVSARQIFPNTLCGKLGMKKEVV